MPRYSLEKLLDTAERDRSTSLTLWRAEGVLAPDGTDGCHRFEGKNAHAGAVVSGVGWIRQSESKVTW